MLTPAGGVLLANLQREPVILDLGHRELTLGPVDTDVPFLEPGSHTAELTSAEDVEALENHPDARARIARGELRLAGSLWPSRVRVESRSDDTIVLRAPGAKAVVLTPGAVRWVPRETWHRLTDRRRSSRGYIRELRRDGELLVGDVATSLQDSP